MQKCKNCQIDILSNDEICPLCQAPLEGKGKDIFPYVPTIYKRYTMFFKILLFCSMVISLVAIFLDIIIPTVHHFSIYVIGALICLIVFLKISLTKRDNIPKSVLWQVISISIFVVLWDYFTGWIGWSITYVVPIICNLGAIDMVILSKVMKLYLDEQLIYFISIILLGLLPGIFIVTNIVSTKIPSLICIFFNILAFVTILIFRWDTIIEEFKRRLHI